MGQSKQLKNAAIALKWISRILKKHQIPYQITGGLAARSYGAQRPLADIDIDIPEKCFGLILAEVKPYITFGPTRYKSQLWDLYLLTLNYKEQIVDISGAYSTKIFNKKTNKWQKISTNFERNDFRKVFNLAVPVISRDELIQYKSVLNRDVDQIDIQQMQAQKLTASFKKLSKKIKQELFDALYFMNMNELRKLCEDYKLPSKDKKGFLIKRIKHFLTTGEILQTKKIPDISIAKKDRIYLLKPKTLILKGSYKNDLQTRKFFQELIGKHFHFTAFGQDWILERWQAGKPPTYNEFANYWQKEFARRKNLVATPKQEWAYLRFLQQYQKDQPGANNLQAKKAWEKVRIKNVGLVKSLLSH